MVKRSKEAGSMAHKRQSEHPIIKRFPGGLVLRRATKADAEAVAAFNHMIHEGPDAQRGPFAAYVRDLMGGGHPSCAARDFTLVENARTGAIVSSLALFSERWSYGGIEFGVGRVELVGTHPDYRRRGLIRAQMETVHEWSARRGHLALGIIGFPRFYRQFGYERAVEVSGGRIGHRSEVPKLKEGEAEPYRVRPAARADLRFIAQTHREGMKRYLVTCVRDGAGWLHELRQSGAYRHHQLRVIDRASGEVVGFLAHPIPRPDRPLGVQAYELKPGVSWLAVTPSVARYLLTAAEDKTPASEPREAFYLWLGAEHPAYEVAPYCRPAWPHSYAHYVRVADIPRLLRHLAAVLERRLAESVVAGHSGELKISFYRNGLRLALQQGCLKHIAPWEPAGGESAAFPGLTFLQLLFGYRSLEELRRAHPDVTVRDDEARLLLGALFPNHVSTVWGMA